MSLPGNDLGEDCEKLQLQRIGEILGLSQAASQMEADESIRVEVQVCVPSDKAILQNAKALRIQVFRVPNGSFFARPVPLIFYSSLDWGSCELEAGFYRGPPNPRKQRKEENSHDN